jgi:hypothetical protein
MKALLARAISMLCVLGGIALVLYGGLLFLGVDSASINKFSSAGRDAGGALLFVFGGAILVLYGSFNVAVNSSDT